MINIESSNEMEESPCVWQATGGWDCDPSAFAAIPAADFARVVRASRGAHCRPLHPRLASSLFRSRGPFLSAESLAWTTAPEDATATASQDNRLSMTLTYRRSFRDGIAVI
jgi:hypothetical protein